MPPGEAKQYVRGERDLNEEQLEYVQQSGKLERAKAQVAKEDAHRREIEVRKAERAAARGAERAAKK